MADQFEGDRQLHVSKVKNLCRPVSKNDAVVINPPWDLLCYSAKREKGQGKHDKRLGLDTNNQFGPGVLDTQKEDLLCVPVQAIF